MKVMFFSLHAAIWQHSAIENRLIREVSKNHIESVFVTCGGTFPQHCTCYSAYNLSLDSPRSLKDQICAKCIKCADVLNRANKAKHIILSAFSTQRHEKLAQRLLSSINQKNYLQLKILGVPVGKIATYECFLRYKKMTSCLNEEEWNFYKEYLRNALLSLFAFRAVYAQENPSKIFFYSPQYVVNGVCARFAELKGTLTYFIEGSSNNAERYKALRIWNWRKYGLENPALKTWPQSKFRVNAQDLRRVTDHFKELFAANSFAVYSAPAKEHVNIRAYYKIPKDAKVILATLSSFDEAYSAFLIEKFPEEKTASKVYPSQFEWIKNTMNILNQCRNTFLIVRLHPRDFPNKREAYRSEQADVWQSILGSPPHNVRVNAPADNISLYSMLNQVDVLLTGWSATGVEALVFGVPVVSYDSRLPSFPADIHFSGRSRHEYVGNFHKALATPKSLTLSFNAYLWLAACFSLGTVKVSSLRDRGHPAFLARCLPSRLRKHFDKISATWSDYKDSVGDIDEEYEANRFLRLINEDEDDLLEKEVQLRALQREDELFKVFRSEIAKLSENIQIAKMAV
jgi:hypothetical protein